MITRQWKPFWLLVCSLVVEVTVYMVVTAAIQRQRPPVRFLEDLRPDASFPSGHTAAAFALYFAIAVAATTVTRNRVWRRAAWTAAVAVPLLVGVSRLYRGMHHPTDVAAGYVMGVGCVAISVLAIQVYGVVSGRRTERVV